MPVHTLLMCVHMVPHIVEPCLASRSSGFLIRKWYTGICNPHSGMIDLQGPRIANPQVLCPEWQILESRDLRVPESWPLTFAPTHARLLPSWEGERRVPYTCHRCTACSKDLAVSFRPASVCASCFCHYHCTVYPLLLTFSRSEKEQRYAVSEVFSGTPQKTEPTPAPLYRLRKRPRSVRRTCEGCTNFCFWATFPKTAQKQKAYVQIRNENQNFLSSERDLSLISAIHITNHPRVCTSRERPLAKRKTE